MVSKSLSFPLKGAGAGVGRESLFYFLSVLLYLASIFMFYLCSSFTRFSTLANGDIFPLILFRSITYYIGYSGLISSFWKFFGLPIISEYSQRSSKSLIPIFLPESVMQWPVILMIENSFLPNIKISLPTYRTPLDLRNALIE